MTADQLIAHLRNALGEVTHELKNSRRREEILTAKWETVELMDRVLAAGHALGRSPVNPCGMCPDVVWQAERALQEAEDHLSGALARKEAEERRDPYCDNNGPVGPPGVIGEKGPVPGDPGEPGTPVEYRPVPRREEFPDNRHQAQPNKI